MMEAVDRSLAWGRASRFKDDLANAIHSEPFQSTMRE